jgi:hypothetical protein
MFKRLIPSTDEVKRFFVQYAGERVRDNEDMVCEFTVCEPQAGPPGYPTHPHTRAHPCPAYLRTIPAQPANSRCPRTHPHICRCPRACVR